MTHAEMLQRGRQLTDEERTLAIRKLFEHEAAPAFVAWLEDNIKQDYVRAIATQQLAAHHGCLEHCAGSIHAVLNIQDLLAQLLLPPQPGRPRPNS